MSRIFNWRPSLKDHRDIKYKMSCPPSPIRPSQVDLLPFCPPIVNQEDESSCAGNAGAFAYDFLQLKAITTHNANPMVFNPSMFEASSRNFLYYNARILEGSTSRDQGVSSLRDICATLQNTGSCPESIWPYNETQVDCKPSDAAYTFAANHKLTSYQSLDGSDDQLKDCLASGYPLILGITVYSSFESDEVAATGRVPMPGPGDDPVGGHAISIVGYDDLRSVYLARNSWGTGWGIQGYFYLPYSYIHEAGLADDFFTLR